MVFDNISVQGQAISGVLASQSINLSVRGEGAQQVKLEWGAVGFGAGTQFIIERSTDAREFTSVFHVSDASQYTDASVPAAAVLYYRIEASLPDGSHYFSSVVSVRSAGAGGMAIKAVTPQGSAVRTLLHLSGKGACQLSIWSQDGRPLARQVINGQEGDIQTDIAFSRPHGVYILTIAGGNGNSSRKFVF
jgi:hypothetical protein